MVVHKGGEDVTAFSDVGLIVLYSDNATKRIGTHDLEETVFHESVHAAWDKPHAMSAEWKDAQRKDGRFVTDYARKNPKGEDLAESALFAYTLIHHPNRIPKEEAAKIARAIPNRIAFVEKLLPKDKPLHFAVEAVKAAGEANRKNRCQSIFPFEMRIGGGSEGIAGARDTILSRRPVSSVAP